MSGCCWIGVDDPAEIWRETRRKARKKHQCFECRRTIPRGVYYWHWHGIQDGRPFRYKVCELCQNVKNDRFPYGFYVGMLWETLKDCLSIGSDDSWLDPPIHPIRGGLIDV